MTPAQRPLLALATLLVLSSCAAAPPPVVPTLPPLGDAELAAAAVQESRGCYRCLLEARAFYDDLVETTADQTAVTTGLFRTTLLIGMRERELGLPAGGSFDRAAELAGRVTALDEWSTYVEIARTTAWQRIGVPKSLLDANTAERAGAYSSRDTWNAILQPLVAANPLAAYLYLTLNCNERWLSEHAELDELISAHDGDLFVRYRYALCIDGMVELSAVLTFEPRFTEMKFFLARLAQRGGDPGLAEFHFREAYDEWPVWPAPALSLGDLTFEVEDYEASVPFYDQTLALVTDQREALLGKAKALSYLDRYADAIPLLDRMIELGTWYMGDAYFWRAWNRFSLDSIALASEDIDRAKTYNRNAAVLTLSGQIAIEEDRLEDARQDLETALQLNANACDAAFHLGRMYILQTNWPETGKAFDRATGCYAAFARLRAEDLEGLRGDPAIPEDRRARLIPRREAQLANTRRQAATSAYNAALGFANAQMLDEATAYARQAAEHPDYSSRAEELLGRIDARR